MTGTITYKGENRHGVAVTGRSTENPVELAEDMYRNGFHWAVIERDGETIGKLETINGEIAWWADAGEDR